MNTKLLFAGSARMMLRYKMRTFFMAIGIVVGVAALVFMRAMGAGAEHAMMENINKTFSTAVMTVTSGGGHMGPRSAGPVTTLKLDDIEAIMSQVDGAVMYAPLQMLPMQEIRYEGANRQLTVYGQSENAEAIWMRGVTQGEYFTAEDVQSASRVAVIGTNAAKALFGDQDPVGKQVQIGTVPFRIKGILEPQGIDTHGLDKDDEIHVPITTLMRRLMNADHLFAARILLDDPGRMDPAAKATTALLRERHAIAAAEPNDFVVITPKLVAAIVDNANKVLTRYLPAAAGVALLVSALVIANIMLIAVKERVPEIGLRKAVGAEDGQINFQFLTETIVVALTAGLFGAGLGVVAGIVYGATGTTPMLITPGSLALGLGTALLVGVLAGVMPARQAAGLDPVKALR